MASIDDILGQIKLPERVYSLCLRADLRAEWEQAEAELDASAGDVFDTLAGVSAASKALAKRVQQLEADMAEHTVPVKLRALAHKVWSDLVAAHPPRDDSDDRQWNAETFGVALLAAAAIDPAMSVEQAGQLVDRLTLGQWSELFATLIELNGTAVDVPKSSRAYELLRRSRKR